MGSSFSSVPQTRGIEWLSFGTDDLSAPAEFPSSLGSPVSRYLPDPMLDLGH